MGKKNIWFRSKKRPGIVYFYDPDDTIKPILNNDCEIIFAMEKKKIISDDLHYLGRFDQRNIPTCRDDTDGTADLSFSDGAEIEGLMPKKKKRPRIKTTNEHLKPEL